MGIRSGKYRHFKGNCYIVYGEFEFEKCEKYVLYRQDYGENSFWIRPTKMFKETFDNENKEIQRFKMVEKIKHEELIKSFIEQVKKKNVIIKHSETEEQYRIISVSEHPFRMDLELINASYLSSYLTDSQMAHRMGFDLYKVNEKKIVNDTCYRLPEDETLKVYNEEEEDREYNIKKIVSKQLNPCSIDLHIADEFYASKITGKIDMTNSMSYSIEPSRLWKKINTRRINGTDAIVLFPSQSVLTYTYEKIELPVDCAGKIEIKSTYARLLLSVTTSDFCNPGWKGHFPLTIRNNGRHIIVIHPREKMLQLSLLPTKAPIINEYKGVFMDDDGTPFRFWRSLTVKHIVTEQERNNVIDFYNKVEDKIKKDSNDVEAEKERFANTFLNFYQKKIKKAKYKNIKDDKKRLKEIWRLYKKREERLKFVFSRPIKLFSGSIELILTLLPAMFELYANKQLSGKLIFLVLFGAMIFGIIECLKFSMTPKCYCTFERLEFEEIYGQ